MEELFKLSDNLTNAIKNSKYYKDYLISREHIKKDSDLYFKVREFKKLHIDLQKKKNIGENVPFDYEKSISQQYHKLILNENVKTFLENEQILAKLIGSIYNRITRECILDFDV